MKAPKDLVIDEVTYRIKPIPAGLGLKVAALLARVAAPVFGTAGHAQNFETAIGGAMAEILTSPALEKDLLFLCQAFASTTDVVTQPELGKPAQQASLSDANLFDLHFAGRYDHLTQWLAAALEYNMSGFFSALPKLAAQAKARAAAVKLAAAQSA